MKVSLRFYITFLLSILSGIIVSAQNFVLDNGGGFELKVKIVHKDTGEYVKDANISVNAFSTSRCDIHGVYRVKARVNDELRVSHPDFETVIHTITSDEDIKIVIEDIDKISRSSFMSKSKVRRRTSNYTQLIDSANFHKEKDLDKSLTFIEEALKANESRSRNANTYKILGDIYFFWKQYDIAISNYKISLQINEKTETLLQLAKTQYLAKKYNDSKKTYTKLKDKSLSIYNQVQILQGLGDVSIKQKEYKEGKSYYEKALKIANEKFINDVVPDLNAKLANVYAKEGNINKANTAVLNTLKQASELAEEPSLQVQQEVADFYNETKQYDNEIKLRKEILKNVDKNDLNTVVKKYENKSTEQKDSLTSQRLNYKIGNAYIQKENYPEAIEYLEKSIVEADKKEDFEVQKHATRKLSEVYATVGDYINALKTYRDFVDIVDTLYIKKEQEIYQIKRLTKKIADNQSRIAILERDKELSDSKISLAIKDKELTLEKSKTQLVVIYSLIGGLLLMSLLAFYKHRSTQKQQLANNLLALKSMRSQMNPHFIFNALNSVNSFIAVNDERNANRYLSEFSVLMRSVLENSDEDFIPFTKEIELLELYVKLEHNRFKDKFEYTITVDKSIDIEQFQIPPMLLQPYIENAIWHGLRYKKEKGKLTIAIDKKSEETIAITITDDGIGRKRSLEMKTKNQLKQKSKGMSTIKNRIAILNDMYQDKIEVKITDAFEDGRGTRVEVILKK